MSSVERNIRPLSRSYSKSSTGGVEMWLNSIQRGAAGHKYLKKSQRNTLRRSPKKRKVLEPFKLRNKKNLGFFKMSGGRQDLQSVIVQKVAGGRRPKRSRR